MKGYKFFRGLLKASAFATVMFDMQACYGAPQNMKEPIDDEEVETYPANDTLQGTEAVTPELETE